MRRRREETAVADPELQRRLEQLHAELAAVSDVDPETQALLAELRFDIESVLERSEPAGLGDRLSGALGRFEATHPRLAGAMGAVVDQLASLGI